MKLQKLSNTWSEIFISFVNKERANALINSATEPRIIDKKPTQYFSAHFSIFNMQNNKWILSESYIPHGDRIIICICFFLHRLLENRMLAVRNAWTLCRMNCESKSQKNTAHNYWWYNHKFLKYSDLSWRRSNFIHLW